MDLNCGEEFDWPIDKLGWILLLQKGDDSRLGKTTHQTGIACAVWRLHTLKPTKTTYYATLVRSSFFFCHLKPHVTLEVRNRAVFAR